LRLPTTITFICDSLIEEWPAYISHIAPTLWG
jgi:hypothetical protein